MSDTTPSGPPDSSTIVAQSLATVGYAMFSLCRDEALVEIPSFGAFMAHVDEQTQQGLGDDHAAEEPSAFGESTVDETLAAPRPETPQPSPVQDLDGPVGDIAQGGPASVASTMLVLGPDGLPVQQSTPADPTPTDPEPAHAVAPVPLPDYIERPKQSMAALNEISFLDE